MWIGRLPEASTLACADCGARIELSALGELARCAHCGHTQAVPPEVLARLRGYAATVQRELARIVGALDDVELFRHEHGTATRVDLVVAVIGIVFLLSLCVVPAAIHAIDDERVTRIAIAACAGVPLLVFAPIVLVRLLRRASRRMRPIARPPLPDVSVRCSGCGGENVQSGGALASSCSFCRAALVAPPAKIAIVVEAVKGYRRAALLAKYAAERELAGPRANAPLVYRNDVAWYDARTREAYASGAWAPLRAWLGVLAGQLAGQPLEGDALSRWLDQHYAASLVHLAPAVGPWSHPRGGVVCQLGGFPALVAIEPRGGAIVLALVLATEEADGAPMAGLAARLAGEPLALAATSGGLLATASDGRAWTQAASVTRVAHVLAAMATGAAELGLAPPSPRPLPR